MKTASMYTSQVGSRAEEIARELGRISEEIMEKAEPHSAEIVPVLLSNGTVRLNSTASWFGEDLQRERIAAQAAFEEKIDGRTSQPVIDNEG